MARVLTHHLTSPTQFPCWVILIFCPQKWEVQTFLNKVTLFSLSPQMRLLRACFAHTETQEPSHYPIVISTCNLKMLLPMAQGEFQGVFPLSGLLTTPIFCDMTMPSCPGHTRSLRVGAPTSLTPGEAINLLWHPTSSNSPQHSGDQTLASGKSVLSIKG